MGLFDSKQKSQTSVQAPDWVQGYLENATGNYGSLTTPETFGGDWQAGLNPYLSGAWNNLFNSSPTYQNMMGEAGGMGIDALGRGMDIARRGFQFDNGTRNDVMASLMPSLQGQFDAGARQINRDLNWNVLPGIDMAASMAGVQGNTKFAQQSDLARSMASDRMVDLGSSLYANAANQATQAGMNAGTQNLGLSGVYGNFGNLGLNAANSAFDMNQAMLNNQLIAGQGAQGYDQMGLDLDRAQFDMQQQNPWLYGAQQMTNLANVGNTTRNTEGTTDPGLGNIALQAGSAAIGGGWNPFASLGTGGNSQSLGFAVPGSGGNLFTQFDPGSASLLQRV